MKNEFYIKQYQDVLEKKYQWGSAENWSNYYFSQVSNDIQKKTGKNISRTTLERIFGKRKTSGKTYIPHSYTRNILAEFIDLKNWEEFENSFQKENIEITEENNESINKSQPIIYILSALVLIVLTLFFILPRHFFKEKIIFICNDTVHTIPFTVVFNYDISSVRDSVFMINYTGSKNYLPKDKKVISEYFYNAGYFPIRLIKGKDTIACINIHVLSDNWQCGYNPKNIKESFIFFLNNDIAKKDGQLYVSPKDLADNFIHPGEFYWTEFRKVDTFRLSGDNMIFRTTFKNNHLIGGRGCNNVWITLLCQNNEHSIHFVDKGCYRWSWFQLGEKKYNGQFDDLSMFEQNIHDWIDVELKIKNKQVTISAGKDTIFKDTYKTSVGELKGIIYKFYGCGVLKQSALYTLSGDTVFFDNFNK